MLLNIAYLIGGLVLLLAGGHYLVNAGVSAAHKFKIAPFIIGSTVVAFGTSAPELLVSVDAALSGHPEIALGNVIGSNIANIALVLGATACIITLPIVSKRLFTDWLLVLVCSILLIGFSLDGNIAVWEGLIFMTILALYIYFAIKSPKVEVEDEVHVYSQWWLIILVFIAAGTALAFGANLLVEGASNIARLLNVSDRVIAITIVAFGTSLPELATSIVAASKKQTDISVGNIIGSNLFNILAVLGITAIIKPINIDYIAFERDLMIMLIVAFILFLMIYPFKANFSSYRKQKTWIALSQLDQGKLSYIGGILLLIIYLSYIYLLFA